MLTAQVAANTWKCPLHMNLETFLETPVEINSGYFTPDVFYTLFDWN